MMLLSQSLQVSFPISSIQKKPAVIKLFKSFCYEAALQETWLFHPQTLNMTPDTVKQSKCLEIQTGQEKLKRF